MSESHKSDWLPVWAAVGVVVLLCGPWLLPSNKYYHQLLIITLWLPALLSLFFRPKLYALIKLPEAVLFVMLACWTYIVLFVSGGTDIPSEAKMPLYVALSLVGIWLASETGPGHFERLLFGCSVLGGYLAGLSWVNFYVHHDHALSERLVAIGLWNRVILAGHAVAALSVMFVCLMPRSVGRWALAAFIPAGLGYLLFLAFCQTRGVWVALAAGVLMLLFVSPGKWKAAVVTVLASLVVLVAFLEPYVLLQRGLSYRPLIWDQGIDLLLKNWSFGVGFNEFIIAGPELGQLAFKHPHNLFLNEGIRLGVFGLMLLVLLWAAVGWRSWNNRSIDLGRTALVLWIVSSVALMTDGIGLWKKPYADWLITWFPIALALIVSKRTQALPGGAPSGRAGTGSEASRFETKEVP